MTRNPFGEHFPEQVLEDLEDLPNYNDWIVSQFAPFLGGHTAEIGAGLGTISGRVAVQRAESGPHRTGTGYGS